MWQYLLAPTPVSGWVSEWVGQLFIVSDWRQLSHLRALRACPPCFLWVFEFNCGNLLSPIRTKTHPAASLCKPSCAAKLDKNTNMWSTQRLFQQHFNKFKYISKCISIILDFNVLYFNIHCKSISRGLLQCAAVFYIRKLIQPAHQSW